MIKQWWNILVSRRKTFADSFASLSSRGSFYSGKFELRLYISDWLLRWNREASGYTSDKWWIGNKWGISAGNIRDIKKEPPLLVIRAGILLEAAPPPPHIRHLDRLKSDAIKLFLSSEACRWALSEPRIFLSFVSVEIFPWYRQWKPRMYLFLIFSFSIVVFS